MPLRGALLVAWWRDWLRARLAVEVDLRRKLHERRRGRRVVWDAGWSGTRGVGWRVERAKLALPASMWEPDCAPCYTTGECISRSTLSHPTTSSTSAPQLPSVHSRSGKVADVAGWGGPRCGLGSHLAQRIRHDAEVERGGRGACGDAIRSPHGHPAQRPPAPIRRTRAGPQSPRCTRASSGRSGSFVAPSCCRPRSSRVEPKTPPLCSTRLRSQVQGVFGALVPRFEDPTLDPIDEPGEILTRVYHNWWRSKPGTGWRQFLFCPRSLLQWRRAASKG